MSLKFDDHQFELGHQAFKRHMFLKSDGVPFTSFAHPFLVDDEITFKRRVFYKANELLDFKHWEKWRKTPGAIIDATKKACGVSEGLLERRFGSKGDSAKALYQVKTREQKEQLEEHLWNVLACEKNAMTSFAIHFDRLAGFLRDNRLGCKWDFVSYLAFLHDPETFFPVKPTYFDRLLKFYGAEQTISGVVSWERYSLLLELADILRRKLETYGRPDAIEIHSYMWVVSYLINDKASIQQEVPALLNFDSELAMRGRQAQERERIGLLGERFVYEQEKQKLLDIGRRDWAESVRLVSIEKADAGYDVLSFSADGSELHIEVKTSTQLKGSEIRFWLSATEKHQAEVDASWRVYRVWSIDNSPIIEDLDNIVINQQDSGWLLTTSQWYVTRKQ